MLAYADLVTTLPALPVQPFAGTLYRAVNYAALHGSHSTSPHVPNQGRKLVRQLVAAGKSYRRDYVFLLAEAHLKRQGPPAKEPRR